MDIHRKCLCGSNKKARWCCEKETTPRSITLVATKDPPSQYYSSSFSQPMKSRETGEPFEMRIFRYHKITSQDKLNNCLDCGKCCSLGIIYIDNPDDCDIAPEHRITDANGKVRVKLKDGWCPYHDRATHKCTIYNGKRPTICSTFERGTHRFCYER